MCSGTQGALCSPQVLEKSSSQKQQEQIVDMKPIQALVIVETLICPQAKGIFSLYGETAGRPQEKRASLLSFLCFFLSPGWLQGHTSLEELISVCEPGIAMSWIYFKQMNIPGSSKVLLSIRRCKNTAIFLDVSNLCA